MGGAERLALHGAAHGFAPAPSLHGRARGTLPRARSAEAAPTFCDEAPTGEIRRNEIRCTRCKQR